MKITNLFFVRVICLVFVCVLSFINSHAQIQDISLQTFSKTQGLPAARIYSIVEDNNGYMWLGSEQGLYIFNGYSFVEVLKHVYKPTKMIADIKCIYVTKDSAILIGTASGLYAINSKTYVISPLIANVKINSIVQTSKNSFVCSSSEQPFLFTIFVDSFTKNVKVAKKALGYNASKVIKDSQNQMWVLSPKQILCISKNKELQISLSDYIECGLFTDVLEFNSKILVLTTQGIYVWNSLQQKLEPYKLQYGNIANKDVYCISSKISKKNVLWIGTDNIGLLGLNANGALRHYYSNSSSPALASNTILAIGEDKNGSLWLSQLGNHLQVLHAKEGKGLLFAHNQNSNLPYNLVKTTLLDSKNTLWIGTDGGGLAYISNYSNSKHVQTLPNSPSKVMALIENKEHIWIGAYKDGLYSIHAKSKKVEHHPIENKNIQVKSVYDLEVLSDNTLLLATLGHGLIVYNTASKSFKSISTLSNKDSSYIVDSYLSSIYKDSKGNFWISSYGMGVYVVNNKLELLAKYDSNNNLDNMIFSVVEDAKKNIWLASFLGMHCINTKTQKVTLFSIEKYSFFDKISHISSSEGKVWISASNTMSAIDINTFAVSTYNSLDKLFAIKNICNEVIPVAKSIFICGDNGIMEINPKNLSNSMPQFSFSRIDIKVDNTNISFSNTITLPYNKNNLFCVFPAVDVQNSSDLQYSCVITGSDSKTYNLGSSYEMLFANLSPGTYTIELLAYYKNRFKQAKKITFTLIITPPFWKTWWFILCIVLSVFLFIIYRIRRHVYKMQKQAFILEQKVAERTHTIVNQNKELQIQTEKLQEINEELVRSNSENTALFRILNQRKNEINNIHEMPKSLDEQFLEKTMEYIHENIKNPDLSVEELSAHVHYSKIQFYRKIKNITGLTPVDVIKTTRLERAKELLQSGKFSIAEVCYNVGFSDPKYFSKCFKEQVGQVPSAYEKENTIEE